MARLAKSDRQPFHPPRCRCCDFLTSFGRAFAVSPLSFSFPFSLSLCCCQRRHGRDTRALAKGKSSSPSSGATGKHFHAIQPLSADRSFRSRGSKSFARRELRGIDSISRERNIARRIKRALRYLGCIRSIRSRCARLRAVLPREA